jgi:hypothetical protein
MSVYAYSVAQMPPIPVCTIYLGVGGEEPEMGPLEAIIDTGADISVIPLGYLRQLRAHPISHGTARGIWGDRRTVRIYTDTAIVRVRHDRQTGRWRAPTPL